MNNLSLLSFQAIMDWHTWYFIVGNSQPGLLYMKLFYKKYVSLCKQYNSLYTIYYILTLYCSVCDGERLYQRSMRMSAAMPLQPVHHQRFNRRVSVGFHGWEIWNARDYACWSYEVSSNLTDIFFLFQYEQRLLLRCIQWWFVNPGSDSPEISLIRTKSVGIDFRFWTDGWFSNPENSLIRKYRPGIKVSGLTNHHCTPF